MTTPVEGPKPGRPGDEPYVARTKAQRRALAQLVAAVRKTVAEANRISDDVPDSLDIRHMGMENALASFDKANADAAKCGHAAAELASQDATAAKPDAEAELTRLRRAIAACRAELINTVEDAAHVLKITNGVGADFKHYGLNRAREIFDAHFASPAAPSPAATPAPLVPVTVDVNGVSGTVYVPEDEARHVCGLNGFRDVPGATCPRCEANRRAGDVARGKSAATTAGAGETDCELDGSPDVMALNGEPDETPAERCRVPGCRYDANGDDGLCKGCRRHFGDLEDD